MDGMTRRSALLAAAALSMAATESQAGEPGQSGEAKRLLLLHIVLPDGQSIDLKASELVIDFGGTARLLVKPDGFAPSVDDQGNQQPSQRLDELGPRKQFRAAPTQQIEPIPDPLSEAPKFPIQTIPVY